MLITNESPAQAINEQHKIKVFNYALNSMDIRIDIIDGEPWFAATDVCKILEIKNPSDTLSKVLDDDEKGVATIYTPGGEQKLLIVNESGLYNLIFQSRKPEARRFRKWVTSVLLPTVRKTGSFSIANLGKGKIDQYSLSNVYSLIRKAAHEGYTWLLLSDLLIASGKKRDGAYSKKCRAMEAKGLAKKLYETRQDKWFIREDGVDEFLGIKPQHKLKELVSHILNKGGSHA